MNWEAIGAVGELLSAVVVVASVIYLGIQIRANTRVSQNEAYRETAEIWNGFLRMLADADGKVVLKALVSYETLEGHEKLQFDTLMTAALNTLEISIEVIESEFIADEVNAMGSMEDYLGRYFAYSGTLEWWRTAKRGCAPSVQEWIDARFPVPDPKSDYWGLNSPATP
jgi:hypothetical protein